MNNDEDRKQRALARYTTAAHGMQSGVAFLMEKGDGKETTPKHLRVGVNSALVEHGALVGMLIKKGVISEVDYLEALATKMEEDRESYERQASNMTGGNIKFG